MIELKGAWREAKGISSNCGSTGSGKNLTPIMARARPPLRPASSPPSRGPLYDLNLPYTGHVNDEPPVPTSPASESVRLQGESNRNRIQFLWTELETCFTLASVAEAEQERGELHAEQSLAAAETGYATLVRFMSDPKHSTHITEQQGVELRAGIERLRGTLDKLLGRREVKSDKRGRYRRIRPGNVGIPEFPCAGHNLGVEPREQNWHSRPGPTARGGAG